MTAAAERPMRRSAAPVRPGRWEAASQAKCLLLAAASPAPRKPTQSEAAREGVAPQNPSAEELAQGDLGEGEDDHHGEEGHQEALLGAQEPGLSPF